MVCECWLAIGVQQCSVITRRVSVHTTAMALGPSSVRQHWENSDLITVTVSVSWRRGDRAIVRWMWCPHIYMSQSMRPWSAGTTCSTGDGQFMAQLPAVAYNFIIAGHWCPQTWHSGGMTSTWWPFSVSRLQKAQRYNWIRSSSPVIPASFAEYSNTLTQYAYTVVQKTPRLIHVTVVSTNVDRFL